MIMVSSDIDNNRKNQRRGQPIRPSRSVEVDYRNALYDITQMLNQQTKKLVDIAKNAPNRNAAAQATLDFIQISRQEIDNQASRIATQFAQQASIQNKQRFESMLKNALNANFLSIVDSENTADVLETVRLTNTGLIKTIPDQHWGKVLQAVNQNLNGTLDTSLTKRLQQIGGITKNRAALIARDQTQKATTQLNQARQLDNGISDYQWQTAEDQRVVGNPSGLYPHGSRMHRNHYARDGKRFSWAKPPSDGHPGEAINCRCIALPIIKQDNLTMQVVG